MVLKGRLRYCGFVLCWGLAVAVVSRPARAATYTWANVGSDWGTAADWSGVVPGSGDVAAFNLGSPYTFQPNLASPQSLGGLWDTGTGSLTVTGSALTLAGVSINGNAAAGIEMDALAGPLAIGAPITLSAPQQWLNNSASLLTVSGSVSNGASTLTVDGSGSTLISGNLGSGAGGLTFSGSGMLSLGGSDAFTGAMTVSAGTLAVATGGIVNKTSSINVNAATLAITGGSVATTGAITAGQLGLGTITVSGGTLSTTNNIDVGSAGVGGTGHAGFAGIFNQTGGYVTAGNIVNLAFQTGSGGGTMNLSGGTIALTTLYNGYSAGSTVNISGSAYAKITNFYMGRESVTANSSIINALNLNGGTLTTGIVSNNGGGDNNTVNFNGGLLQASAASANFLAGMTNAYVLAGGAVVDTNGYSIAIGQSLLSGAAADGGLTVMSSSGAGALTLSSSNNFNGPTNVNSGTLLLGNSAALSQSTLVYNNAGGAISWGSPTTFQLGGLSGSQSLPSLPNNATLNVGANGQSTSFGGTIAGNGANLVKTGSGILTLSGANLYTGATAVSSGTLAVNGSLAAASSVGIADAGTLSGAGTIGGNVTLANGSINLAGGVIGGNVAVTGSGSINLGGGAIAGSLNAAGGNWSGSGTVAGPLTITGGQFTVGGGALLNANGGLAIAGGSLGGAGTIDGNATLSGNAAINLSGGTINGTLAATGGNWSGMGTVAGAVTSSSGLFTIGSGANLIAAGGLTVTAGTLSGLGAISGGTAALGSGVVVAPGATPAYGSAGTLALASLSATGGSNFNFDLSGSPSGSNDLIAVANNLTLGGSNSLLIYPTAGTLASGSAYTLFTYGGTLITGGSSPLVLAPGTIGGRQTAIINYGAGTNSAVTLTINGYNANLTWIGTSSTTWVDNPTLKPWTSPTSPSGDYFTAGDIVTFNDAASTTSIALSGTLNPSSVTVSGTNNFTFSGGGTIQGLTSLTLNGPGSLIVANTNGYSGGTYINGGSLVLGGNNALPVAGTITFGMTGGAGTFDLAGYNQTVAGLVIGGAASASDQIITASSGSSTLTFNSAGSSAFYGTIQDAAPSGGTLGLTVAGGTLDITAGNPIYSGKTAVCAGVLLASSLPNSSEITVGAAGALCLEGASINVPPLCNSGSAAFTATSGIVALAGLTGTGTTSFAAGATIPAANSGTINFNGSMAVINSLGNAVINLNGTSLLLCSGSQTGGGAIGGNGSVTVSGTGTLVLAGSNTYGGGTALSSGLLSFAAGGLPATGGVTLSGGTLQWNGTNTQDISSQLVMIDSTTASLDDNGNNITLAAAFGSNTSAALQIGGSGAVTLAGANTFTGGLIVAAGTAIDGAAAKTTTTAGALGPYNTSAAAITVLNGATFDMNGAAKSYNFPYGLTIAGSGVNGLGALINSGASGSNNTQSSPNITLAADATIGGSGDIYMTGPSHAADTLNLNGFTLTKTGNNTLWLDSTTVTAGTVCIMQGAVGVNNYSPYSLAPAAGAASFVLADSPGAALSLTNGLGMVIGSLSGGGAVGGNVALSNDTLTINGPSATTYAGSIGGNGGGLTLAGGGMLTLTGASTVSTASLQGAATLVVDGGLNVGALNAEGSACLAGSGSIVLTSGTTGFDYDSSATSTFAGSISDQNAGALAVNSGTLTLSGNNTYTGGTTVDQTGTLILTNNEALADGSSLVVGDASAFTNSPAAPAEAAGASIAAVPEPGTLALVSFALCGAAIFRRVRRFNSRKGSACRARK